MGQFRTMASILIRLMAFWAFLQTTLAFTCPRLAPTSISGKVIPCRFLCIKISFVEMPSIILEKERDGAMCKTLFLRRRGTCQGGSCVPFPKDGNPPTKGSVMEKAQPRIDEPPVKIPPITGVSVSLPSALQPPASRPSDELSSVPLQPAPPSVNFSPSTVVPTTGKSIAEALEKNSEARPGQSLTTSSVSRTPPPRSTVAALPVQPTATESTEGPPDGGVRPPVVSKPTDLAKSLTGTLSTLNPISAAAKAAGGLSGAIGAARNLMPSSLTGDLAKDVTGTSSTLETAPVAGKATDTVSNVIRTASNLVPSPLRSLFAPSTGKK
ncbi:unnamed protein product [Ixodes pacificus]